MSRTIRRKGQERDHAWHFDRYRDLDYGWYYLPDGDGRPREVKIKAHIAYFYTDNYTSMTTPMWWYKMIHQVPLRRKERDLIKNVLKMKHLDEIENVVFPHYKKPHIYYW